MINLREGRFRLIAVSMYFINNGKGNVRSLMASPSQAESLRKPESNISALPSLVVQADTSNLLRATGI